MSDLLASFGKPFAYQVAAYRLRLMQLAPTTGWDKEIWKAQHDRAFMVAGAMKADILADLAAMVGKAIAQGGTLDEFRRDFRAMVAAKGWQISKAGQGTKGGEAWRTKVIYRTNMATSRAAGRLAQLRAGGFKFFVYNHGASLEPREQHLAWDGLVLEADHPFWDTHAPPNGWGCSCYLTGARSRESAHRVGGKPEKKLPPDWRMADTKTGAPFGISRGWDYSPGASVSHDVAIASQKIPKLPAEIGVDFAAAISSSIGRMWEAWVEEVFAGTTYELGFAGTLTKDILESLKKNEIFPQSAEIFVKAGLLNGKKAARHTVAGDAFDKSLWLRLSMGLRAPMAVLQDTKKGNLIFLMEDQGERIPQLALALNFVLRIGGKNMTTNQIVSAYLPKLSDLKGRLKGGFLLLLYGKLE